MSESKAALASHKEDLIKRLQVSYDKIKEQELEIVRLRQVLLVPTDAMIDEAFPIIGFIRSMSPPRIADLVLHCKNYGRSINSWPQWIINADQDTILSKGATAELIWSVMANAAPPSIGP